MNGTKTCPKCKETKDHSSFHRSSRTRDGLNVYCTACKNAYKQSLPPGYYPRKRLEPLAQKKCSICKKVKPSSEYSKNPRNSHGLFSSCKECRKAHLRSLPHDHPTRIKARLKRQAAYQANREEELAKQKARRQAIPPEERFDRLKAARYGLKRGEFAKMVAAQGGACAICRKKSPRGKRLHVDHCHATNEVRGAICFNCNSLLGHARDTASVLLAAVEYLTNPPARMVLATSAGA